MSAQLYSDWLSTVKVKCFLPFPMPCRTNLPKEYQPGLETRLRELSVDFTLEERILNESLKLQEAAPGLDAQPSDSSDLVACKSKDKFEVCASSVLENNKAKQVENSVNVTDDSQASNKEKSEEILSNVLDQFDTLHHESDLTPDEINNHLAELFSKSVSTLPNSSAYHQDNSANENILPEFLHKAPNFGHQFDANSSHQTYIDCQPRAVSPHPSAIFRQLKYDSSPIPHGVISSSNLIPSQPLPPPKPFPKPIITNLEHDETIAGSSEKVLQLVSMGFPESRATSALSACDYNIDKAVEALLEDN